MTYGPNVKGSGGKMLSVESDDEVSTFRRSRPATQCTRMKDLSYGSAHKRAELLINRRELHSNGRLDRPFPSAYDCTLGRPRWIFTRNEKREMSCSRVPVSKRRRRPFLTCCHFSTAAVIRTKVGAEFWEPVRRRR